MGSGSTGVACMITGRRFIGIEQEEKYFTAAEQRINDVRRVIYGYTEPKGDEGLQLKDFIADVGNNAKAHGFREVNTNASDFVALIHSEASEVLEEFRKGKEATETYYREDGKPEGVPSELADIVIRCFDMADYYGIDLEAAILEKHKFNKSRPYLHGKKF